jgi:hypothetical protein
MNPIRTALAATTALVASTSLSFANVISQTLSYSASTNWGVSTQSPGFTPTHTLSFSGFNTSLGTLTSVLLTFKNDISGSITLANNGSSATSVSGFLANVGRFSVPSFSTVINLDSNSIVNSNLAGNSTYGPFAAGATSSKTHSYTTNLSVFDTSWTALIGDYGSVSTSSGNGNGSATYTDLGGLSVIASYTYTPATTTTTTTNAPEPASLAALGSGLIGLGVLRRRKKQ